MWKENAVAVERRQGEAVIVCEGALADVVATLLAVKPGRLAGIRVSLPDRHAAPYSLQGEVLQDLLADPERPASFMLPLLPATVPESWLPPQNGS